MVAYPVPTKQITYILFAYYLQHPCFSHYPLSGSIEQEIRVGGGGVGERETQLHK
jgi:hypothetical protein